MSSEALPPPLFAGEVSHHIDGKFRITIPAGWREGDADAFFFMPDSTNCFVRAMRPAEFRAAATKPTEQPVSPREQMEFQRYFYSRAHQVVADKQGRLVLPDALRSNAQLKLQGDVVLVGTFDSFEIWNKALWEQTKAEKEALFQHIAGMRGL